MQEDDFFDIDGLLYGVEVVDLNGDRIDEVAVTVVKDKMYKMVILNYGKDGVLRPFPIFEEKDSNFEGIRSKFRITIEDKDAIGAFPKIVARMPDYGDDNSDWLGVSKYYKWNGIGFELL